MSNLFLEPKGQCYLKRQGRIHNILMVELTDGSNDLDLMGVILSTGPYHHPMPNGSLSLAEYPAAMVRLTCAKFGRSGQTAKAKPRRRVGVNDGARH